MNIKIIFTLILLLSMAISAVIIMSFDGLKIYCKGVRLFNEEYENCNKYHKVAFNVFEITRIVLVVLVIFIILAYINGFNIINLIK